MDRPARAGEEDARELLLALYAAALRAADPEIAVMRALACSGDVLLLRGPDSVERALPLGAGVRLAALGKAAVAMARGAVRALGERVRGGVVVAPRAGLVPRVGASAKAHDELEGLRAAGLALIGASHPLPDEASVRGGRALLEAARTAARAGELFLVLLSGGASALAEVPEEPLALEDLREMGRLLLASGAPIDEMNLVRKRLSRIKGGKLARAARPARVVTLALSDVAGAPLEAIGGGPTLPAGRGWRAAWDVLARRGLAERVPARVRSLFATRLAEIGADATISAAAHAARSRAPAEEFVGVPMVGMHMNRRAGDSAAGEDLFLLVGDAALSAEAARAECARRGLSARVLDAALQGDAEAFARTLPRLVAQARAGTGGLSAPCCLIWAGELTVEVRGAGTGGRNQQLALAFALACEGDTRVALAALATDGVDGPSGAAGAIVDGASAAKMRAAGIDPARALRENDSFPALAAAGALVQTGASGTNVNDLFLLYVA